MVVSDGIKRRFELLTPVIDDRTRRLVAAAEALALGWEHINLTGDYVWRQSKELVRGSYRPLRSAPKTQGL